MRSSLGRPCNFKLLLSAPIQLSCITVILSISPAFAQRATPDGVLDAQHVQGSLIGIQYEQCCG
jgi:hypothetical protein